MHEITSTDGMFSVREMPWHGLGVVLPDHPTREEAQQLAHPWEPIETETYRAIPVITETGPQTAYEVVPGSKVIERSDNGAVLGVVNDTFQPVGNGEMWDVIEAVGKIGSDILIETAGSLKGGREVWALLRFDEPLQVKGDPNGGTVAYLAFQNGHAGDSAFRAQAVNTRIVCANTSRAADLEARASGYEFTFRHSKNVGERIDEAKAAVAAWRQGAEVWQSTMEHFLTYRVTPEEREEFVQRFHPYPSRGEVSDRVANNIEEARSELRGILNGVTQEGIDHTAYGLYQAGIEWNQHFRRTRGKSDRERMESHFRRSVVSTDQIGRSILTLAAEVAHVG